MITKVKLPKEEANMYEGTIGKWFKAEGDKITKGDSLVEVVTDKAVFELEAPKSGLIRQIITPEKSVVPPGYIIALIGKPDDKLPDVEKENQQIMSDSKQDELKELKKTDDKPHRRPIPGPKGKPARIRATPAAKRLAKENSISLEQVKEMFDATVINEKMILEYMNNR